MRRPWRRGTPPRKDRQLLFKSPPPTARFRILRQLFPRARCVYIHRHPEVVAQQAVLLILRFAPLNALQGFTAADAEAVPLDCFRCLPRASLRDRSLLAPGELVEVPYGRLTADPAGTLRHICDTLGLHGAAGGAERARICALRGRIGAAAAAAYTAGGKLNRHPPSSAEAVARLHATVPEVYEAGGYRPSCGVAAAATASDGGGGSDA